MATTPRLLASLFARLERRLERPRVVLRNDEYVLSADEKTSIQAPQPASPDAAARGRRAMRVEHEYEHLNSS